PRAMANIVCSRWVRSHASSPVPELGTVTGAAGGEAAATPEAFPGPGGAGGGEARPAGIESAGPGRCRRRCDPFMRFLVRRHPLTLPPPPRTPARDEPLPHPRGDLEAARRR